jgi:hypothetical protein
MAVVMVVAVLMVIVVVIMVMMVAGAGAFDVVVVAFLGQADFGLEAEDLGAVLAQRAVHGVSPWRICSTRSANVSMTPGGR